MLAGRQSLFFPVRANRLLGFLLRYKLHKKNSQINQIKRTKFPLKHLWSGSSGREGFVTSSLADSNSCIKSTDQEGLTLKRILTQNRFSQREKKNPIKRGFGKFWFSNVMQYLTVLRVCITSSFGEKNEMVRAK